MPVGEITRWASKLRLSEIRRADGSVDPRLRGITIDRLVNTIVDQTWQQNGSAVHPIVSVHADETFIYVELLAMEEAPERAVAWRLSEFNSMGFRYNVEKAIRSGVDAYERKDYGRGFIVDASSFQIVDHAELGRRKPRRLP